MMIRAFLTTLPILMLLGMSANIQARGLYCDGRLVQAGDPIWQVGRACPEPFWRENYDRAGVLDCLGRIHGWQRVEIWTMNFGQRRLMRRLVFVDGRLDRVDALGYGVPWNPGSRRCTPRELEQAGRTVAEIYARCGHPDHHYELSSPELHGYWAGPHSPRDIRERWTYDFGPRHHARELEFINGRLQRIDTLRR
jgi:hypothetical protein